MSTTSAKMPDLNQGLDDYIAANKLNRKSRGRKGAPRRKPEGGASGKKQGKKNLTPRARIRETLNKRRLEKQKGKRSAGKAKEATPVRKARPVQRPAPEKEANEEKGKRVRVSNIDKKVNNTEIYDLFARCGYISTCGIQFDQLGRSTGVAFVTFERAEAAKKAIDTYNGMELDDLELSVRYANQEEHLQNIRIVPGIRRNDKGGENAGAGRKRLRRRR